MPGTPQKGLPTLLSNTLYLLMGNGASVLITMFLSMVLAQSLMPAGYGEYNFILAIVFPSMLIAEFGFSTLIVRELSGTPHLARPLLRRLLPLRLAISATVIVAVTGLVAAFVSTHHMSHLPFALPIILTYPLFAMVTAALRARQRMAWVSLLNVGLLIAQALWLVAERETLSIQYALLIYSATAVGQLVAAAVVFWRMTKADAPQHLNVDYAKWIARCIPFAVANILGALQIRLVLLLLGIHDYHVQMGFYAAATKFSDAARMLPMAYFDAVFPRLSARRSDPLAVHRMRRQVIFVTLAYSLLASGFMLWLAQPLILLVFGSMYLPSADILSLLALIFVPATLHAALRLEAYATGYEWVGNGISLSIMGILYTSAVFGNANGVYNLLTTSLILETTACIVLGLVLFSGVSLRRASTTIPYTPAK
jgi:O-antigen/teichoic acid export membrane protein